jgi:Na+/phosphate symporter
VTPAPTFRIYFERRRYALQRLSQQISGLTAQTSDEGGKVTDAADTSEKMADLQKMRVALVILTSQETSKLLSRRQRVAGKEIEVMCAERDLHQGVPGATREALDALYTEDAVLRQQLRETETEIEKMEDVMVKINADIASLCQS